MIFREIREKQENVLSHRAAKSTATLGRRIPEKKCPIRPDFERDSNRIQYSSEFRRMRYKTQVFFNPKNDHVCTRLEHVLNVAAISTTVCRALSLNQDLTYAIALGHDLGHAPFGHSGEKLLDKCMKKINEFSGFNHERHSLRVVDKLATRISKESVDGRPGLNLTFEVRDGIVCHCGEIYDEYYLECDKTKEINDIGSVRAGKQRPYTLEACVVRLVDKIAYVGRDIEDALRVNLINKDDISKEIIKVLGRTNSDIINTLVMDLLENSYDRDYISLSREKGEALHLLINENTRLIYKSDKILRYEKNAANTLEGLFFSFYEALSDMEKLKNTKSDALKALYEFVIEKYTDINDPKEQIVTDYIAGMTDSYAIKTFEEIYWL